MSAPGQTLRATGRLTQRSARQTWMRAFRRAWSNERYWLFALVALVLAAAASSLAEVQIWPFSVLVLPLYFSSLVLSPRTLPWFVVFVLAATVVMAAQEDITANHNLIRLIVLFILALAILLSSFRRSRLGVSGPRGESMLVDLRDRISNQGAIPELPRQWYVEAVMRSAGGSSFAGDFIVASKSRTGSRLDLVVTDVSGKGEQAGTRALLLSGAFNGLIAALPAGAFLPAANEYLLRLDWDEGFATAIHLSMDLASGDFELRSAGHPPGVQLSAGSGRWLVHHTEGPVLGLIPDATFTCSTGTLRRGDAMLLYTDGLVETPERDISLGIDKLVGQGERLLRAGFESGARKLVDRLDSANDDRALLLVHRR